MVYFQVSSRGSSEEDGMIPLTQISSDTRETMRSPTCPHAVHRQVTSDGYSEIASDAQQTVTSRTQDPPPYDEVGIGHETGCLNTELPPPAYDDVVWTATMQ